MTDLRIREAAALLGVSDDTVRRWVDQGRLSVTKDASNRQVVSGIELAALVLSEQSTGRDALDSGARLRSARNRFTGLVTKVTSDTVMSQVEL